MSVLIRKLSSTDAAEFNRLRFGALAESPTAFGASQAEEAAITAGDREKEMAKIFAQDSVWFGAFAEDSTLIATACFKREPREKYRHRGWIWGMYVAPSFRGQKIASRMMEKLLAEVRLQSDLEYISLHVTAGNDAARKLYELLGFKSLVIEDRAFKIDGNYYAEETMRLFLR